MNTAQNLGISARLRAGLVTLLRRSFCMIIDRISYANTGLVAMAGLWTWARRAGWSIFGLIFDGFFDGLIEDILHFLLLTNGIQKKRIAGLLARHPNIPKLKNWEALLFPIWLFLLGFYKNSRAAASELFFGIPSF